MHKKLSNSDKSKLFRDFSICIGVSQKFFFTRGVKQTLHQRCPTSFFIGQMNGLKNVGGHVVTRQTRQHLPSRVARTRQTRRHLPSRVARTRQTRRHSPSHVAWTRQTCERRVWRVLCEFSESGEFGECRLDHFMHIKYVICA
jgi:hypothetical protein